MRTCTEVVEETEESDDEFEADILPKGVSGHSESTELSEVVFATLVILSCPEADVFYELVLSALLIECRRSSPLAYRPESSTEQPCSTS